MTRLLARASVFLTLVALGLTARERRACAHAVGVSSGEYRLDGKVLYGDLGMAGGELARWLPAIDADHDGAIDADEIAAGRETVARALAAGVTVSADGKACPGSLDRAWVLEAEGGAIFQVRYTCPEVPDRLLAGLPSSTRHPVGHRYMARVFRAGKAQA